VIELFKSLGIIFTVFIAFHYYSHISDAVSSVTTLPVKVADVATILFLIVVVVIAFKFIREGFLILFKIEPKSLIDKWCALFLGIFRAGLIASLMVALLFFTTSTYIRNSIMSSNTGERFLNLTPRVYSFCFENIVARFFPGDKLNPAVFGNLDIEEY